MGNEKGQSRETGNLPVSLVCPFSLPLLYSPAFICPVSWLPYFASFAGLSFLSPVDIL
jgi:hypothetical protein